MGFCIHTRFEFKKGNFVVNTRGNSFSKIAMNQAQKHNNKKVKSVSGYINLVNQEDKKLLKKIELCWPEIHQYLESFEGSPVAQGHKEKTPRLLQHSTRIVSRFMKIF